MSKGKSKTGIKLGWVYCCVHFAVEVACFYYLYGLFAEEPVWGMAALVYDVMAFMPQSMIGVFVQKYPRVRVGEMGGILLILSFFVASLPFAASYWVGLILLALGNAGVHIWGAFATMTTAEGKLTPSAVFVAGGSFGVVTGMFLAGADMSAVFPLSLMLAAVVLMAGTDRMWRQNGENEGFSTSFDLAAERPFERILILAFIVVMIRSYMAYGIPTAWNKTEVQTIALYFSMGIGKALGGMLADHYGAKRVALFSSLLAFPFLAAGNHQMYVSLIGIMLFSMTMSITLGVIASVLRRAPGLAFGITTIGLLFGCLPVFFYRIQSFYVNVVVLGMLTVIAAVALNDIIKGRNAIEEKDNIV